MPSVSNEQTTRLSFQEALFLDGGLFARDARTADSFDQYLRSAAGPEETPTAERPQPPAPAAAPPSAPAASTDPRPSAAEHPSRPPETNAQPKPAPTPRPAEDSASSSNETSQPPAAGDVPPAKEPQQADKEAAAESAKSESAKKEKSKDDSSKERGPEAKDSVPLAQAQPQPIPTTMVPEKMPGKASQTVAMKRPRQAGAAQGPAGASGQTAGDAAAGDAPAGTLAADAQAARIPSAGDPSAAPADAASQAAKTAQAQAQAEAAQGQATPPTAEAGKATPRRRGAENRRNGGDGAAHEGGKAEKSRAATQQGDPSPPDAPPPSTPATADTPQPTTTPAAPAAVVAAATADSAAQPAADAKPSAAPGTQPIGIDTRASASQREATKAPPQSSAPAGQGPDAGVAERAKFVQRVASAFRAAIDPGGTVRLKLSPAELGSLRLEVSVRGGVMNAKIEAETEAARSLLLENLPMLRERLSSQDIRVQNFQVELRDSPQQGFSGQAGNPSFGEGQGQSSPHPRWRAAAAEDAAPAEAVPMRQGTDAGRLNVIV